MTDLNSGASEARMDNADNAIQDQESQVNLIVYNFLNGGQEELKQAIAYLQNHPDDVSEFTMQVKDSFADTDKYTPVLKLAELIRALLQK